MSDVVRLTYTVTVEVDPDVWELNYGTAPAETSADISDVLREVISEQTNGWFRRTGNTGLVRTAVSQ